LTGAPGSIGTFGIGRLGLLPLGCSVTFEVMDLPAATLERFQDPVLFDRFASIDEFSNETPRAPRAAASHLANDAPGNDAAFDAVLVRPDNQPNSQLKSLRRERPPLRVHQNVVIKPSPSHSSPSMRDSIRSS
jgi:hypothetical protein